MDITMLTRVFSGHFKMIRIGKCASHPVSRTDYRRVKGYTYIYMKHYHGVSNHQLHHCLPNRLFMRWPLNSPHKWPVERKMLPFDDVIMLTATLWNCLRNHQHLVWLSDLSLWLRLGSYLWRPLGWIRRSGRLCNVGIWLWCSLREFDIWIRLWWYFLDNVKCDGYETSLWDCPRNDWGDNDCGDGEDAGVLCGTFFVPEEYRRHFADNFAWWIIFDENVCIIDSLLWRHNGRDGVSNHPTTVYLTLISGADQIKHQSSASLAFVQGIHRWPVNSPHKWPVTRKMTSSCLLLHCGTVSETTNI